MKKIRVALLIATISLSFSIMLSGCSAASMETTTTTTASETQSTETTTLDGSTTAAAASAEATTSNTQSDITDFSDIDSEKVTLIALGNSDVPVGQYSQEILTSLGIWDSIQTKISYCGNVKEVLAQVSEGSVDCGIVYSTDAASEPAVSVVMSAPADTLKTPVVYPAAALSASKNPEAANAFLKFLLTSDAKSTFERAGFTYIAESEDAEITSVPDCTLTIFAAASMTESLTTIGDLFMALYPNVTLVMNFDSSGTLLTQIESGSEADIFISAAQKQMTSLTDAGYIAEESNIDLLSNEVVLIVPAE